jgi:hypothetical protein
MDTPLHALAVPDADPRTLKRPEDSAAEIIETMLVALPRRSPRWEASVIVHEPGESHFELRRCFANDVMLDRISEALVEHGYCTHEFGDSMLIERQPRIPRQ